MSAEREEESFRNHLQNKKDADRSACKYCHLVGYIRSDWRSNETAETFFVSRDLDEIMCEIGSREKGTAQKLELREALATFHLSVGRYNFRKLLNL